MAKAQFNKDAAAEVLAADDSDLTAGEPSSAVTLHQPQSLAPIGEIGGAADDVAIRLPYLQLVQGTSKLAAVFSQGDWVLGKENLLAAKNEPLKLVVLRGNIYYKEYAPAEGQLPGRLPDSASVLAAGGRTEWSNGVGPTHSLAADWDVLIEKPEKVICSLFGLELDGKIYAPARWSTDKTAFNKAGAVINSAAKLALRARGLPSATWELRSIAETKNGKVFMVPRVALVAHNSDAFLEQVKSLFAGM